MPGRERNGTGRWSRGAVFRAAAVVAGGAAMGSARDDGSSLAASSRELDAEILGRFLELEQVQEAFYREALRAGRMTGDVEKFAERVGHQEGEHVALLQQRLGSGARSRPETDFGDVLGTPERFLETAIRLEEATISAYIAQAANLSREAVAAIVPMLSVEARHVAWARDLAGTSPAPRAADPGRDPDAILADLRDRGMVR